MENTLLRKDSNDYAKEWPVWIQFTILWKHFFRHERIQHSLPQLTTTVNQVYYMFVLTYPNKTYCFTSILGSVLINGHITRGKAEEGNSWKIWYEICDQYNQIRNEKVTCRMNFIINVKHINCFPTPPRFEV